MVIKNSLSSVEMPAKIGEAGEGLSVLICSDYKHHFNWMSYSCWYSVNRHFPKAKVTVSVSRPHSITHYLYNWVYKINDLRYMLHQNVGEKCKLPYLNKIFGTYLALKRELVKQPLLVLESDMVATDTFLSSTVDNLNEVKFATNPPVAGDCLGPIWYFNKQPLEKFEEVINNIGSFEGRRIDLQALFKVFGDEVVFIDDLGNEVQEKGVAAFTHYRESCGNFTKNEWEKGKTVPPFKLAYALQTIDMSVNEKKVISLWSQMGNLYDAVCQVKL